MTGRPATRRFSKRLVIANTSAAWGMLFYSIYSSQAAVIIGPVLGFIIMMFGLYAGVGHMDLRSMIEANAAEANAAKSNAAEASPDPIE